jgi:GDPmannose 4,6-dehydratase
MAVAIVTGVTGQDGSYLADLLLEKGYHVHGTIRRTTRKPEDTWAPIRNHRFTAHDADLEDQASLLRMLNKVGRPERLEVYNLAAQSHVAVSFACPLSTTQINYVGVLNLLESLRQLDLLGVTRFYQASTSEMFGDVLETPQKETTPFNPCSPYGVAKVAAHMAIKNYRDSYGLFGCCGILFNHESPRRGYNFVTQKIVKEFQNVFTQNTVLELGNLDAKRDWGHAKDYVRAMWMMLQQDAPGDYVVATGEQHSVRDFVEAVVRQYRKDIRWEGEGLSEIGLVDDRVVVRVNPEFYRPCEVNTLLGDSTKIRSLGWGPMFSLEELVKDMCGNAPRAITKLY